MKESDQEGLVEKMTGFIERKNTTYDIFLICPDAGFAEKKDR
jgi:hypothetical protein